MRSIFKSVSLASAPPQQMTPAEDRERFWTYWQKRQPLSGAASRDPSWLNVYRDTSWRYRRQRDCSALTGRTDGTDEVEVFDAIYVPPVSAFSFDADIAGADGHSCCRAVLIVMGQLIGFGAVRIGTGRAVQRFVYCDEAGDNCFCINFLS